MARRPKPWYRKSRKNWYVTLGGTQHCLGPHKREAYDRFYNLMRQPRERKVSSESLAAVLDTFLDYVHQNRSPSTYEWYRLRLQQFLKAQPDLLLTELKPFHVQEWVDAAPNHSPTTKRNRIRAVKRCLHWAAQQGYIANNPIANLAAPSARRRELVVSPQEFTSLLTFVPDRGFRDLLLAVYETGCRPQEILKVEARHADLARARWVLNPTESKTKQMPRVVYLSQQALGITKRLMDLYPQGKLFRNSAGDPWTKDSVGCAFDRLQVRMGKAEMKRLGIEVDETDVVARAGRVRDERTVHGTVRRKTQAERLCEARRKLVNLKSRQFAPRYSLYTLRHSWATNALRNGVDSLTVAILMGHRDPSTLARVYQHLSLSPDHLLAQARRAAT